MEGIWIETCLNVLTTEYKYAIIFTVLCCPKGMKPIITQVATHTHSTPLECKGLNTPFSIDISPLWGEEPAEKGSSNG